MRRIVLLAAAVLLFAGCSSGDSSNPESPEDVLVDAVKMVDGGQAPDVYTWCDPTTSGIRIYASRGSDGARSLSVIADPNCGGSR